MGNLFSKDVVKEIKKYYFMSKRNYSQLQIKHFRGKCRLELGVMCSFSVCLRTLRTWLHTRGVTSSCLTHVPAPTDSLTPTDHHPQPPHHCPTSIHHLHSLRSFSFTIKIHTELGIECRFGSQ